MTTARTSRAVTRAREDATAIHSAPPDGRTRAFVAIGDPQASLQRFFDVLDAHGLLGDDGRLRPEVGLISIGDHFDWGPVAARGRAALDGHALLSWLAAHPSDQAILIAGNHDVARVSELWDYDDARFRRAQALADGAYLGNDEAALSAFRQENPTLPSAEIVSRDLSCFRVEQRALIAALLDVHRLRLAFAHRGALYVHAGVTVDELAAIGGAVPAVDASAIAVALNAALDKAWRDRSGPLVIPGLHAPGDARREGEGMLFHRASRLEEESPLWDRAVPRRRFSPYRLPRGLVQVIGHIQDTKTRRLLSLDGEAVHGRVRTLDVDDTTLTYALGVGPPPAGASRLIHIDGGMQLVGSGAAYALLDAESLTELRAS